MTSNVIQIVKKKWKLIAIILAAAVLLSVIGIVLGICFSSSDDDADNGAEVSQFNTLVGTFTDRTIENEQDAILAVQDVADDLGLKNAAAELSVKSTNTVENLTYYRLQQNCRGIPVYGSTFVVVSDENGEAQGLTSNARDVHMSPLMRPTVTQEQVEASIQAYVGEGGDVLVPELSEDMLVVYNYNDVDQATLAYEINVTIGGYPYEMVVGANNGQVLKYVSLTYTNSVEAKDEANNMYVYDGEDKTFSCCTMFRDSKENVYYTDDGETAVDTVGKMYKMSYDSGEDVYEIYDEETIIAAVSYPKDFLLYPMLNNQAPTAIALLSESKAKNLLEYTQKADAFFEEMFGRDGFDGNNGNIYLVYDCLYESNGTYRGDNAYSHNESGMDSTIISIGNAQTLSVDLVAHEFTHSVERSISNMAYEGESGAIMEGYSDVFGELVELFSHGKCDWIHGSRNMINPQEGEEATCYYELRGQECPSSSKNKGHNQLFNWHIPGLACWVKEAHPAKVGDAQFMSTISSYDNGGVHWNSTVVSHAAYLMTQSSPGGTALTTDELAHLWYNTLFTLPQNCSFNTLRQNMLMVAKSKNYTEEQIKCIAAAFDEVGIDGMDEGSTAWETYVENPTLQVYGVDMKLYDNYTVDIIKFGNDKSENKHIAVADTLPVQLTMSAGRYTITVRDKNDENNIVSKNIRIEKALEAEKSEKTIVFATNFGGVHTHVYATSTQDSTCTVPGWEKQICECGDVKEEKELPLIEHNYVKCVCSMCGNQSHSFSDWLTTVYPTNTEKGAKTRICMVCNHVENGIIPELNHEHAYVTTETQAATCTTEGWEKQICECGDVVTNSVKTIAHKYTNGVCSMCGKAGTKGSVGLAFALSEDGKSYAVKGIGTCTDTDLVIPTEYNGLPVTAINSRAFEKNTRITSVEIPDSVTFIGIYAFESCMGLKLVSIGNGVRYIPRAFSKCENLEVLHLGNKLEHIGFDAFWGCSSLESVTIPDGVKEIEERAFAHCRSLTSIVIPSSVEHIGVAAFAGCTNVMTLTIESDTKQIKLEELVFGYCTAIKLVKIGKEIVEIPPSAFSGCESLAVIEYAGTKSEWNAIPKGTDWDKETGNYIVRCKDGDIDSSVMGDSAGENDHTHAYTRASKHDGENHAMYCSCGDYIEKGHQWWADDDSSEAGRVVFRCFVCGEAVEKTGRTYVYARYSYWMGRTQINSRDYNMLCDLLEKKGIESKGIIVQKKTMKEYKGDMISAVYDDSGNYCEVLWLVDVY